MTSVQSDLVGWEGCRSWGHRQIWKSNYKQHFHGFLTQNVNGFRYLFTLGEFRTCSRVPINEWLLLANLGIVTYANRGEKF